MAIPSELLELIKDWNAAHDEGDTARVIDLTTEDIQLVAAEAPIFSGQAMVRHVYNHVFGIDNIRRTSQVIDCRVDGNLASVLTEDVVNFRPKNGDPERTLELRQDWTLVQSGGAWKVARILSNTAPLKVVEPSQ